MNFIGFCGGIFGLGFWGFLNKWFVKRLSIVRVKREGSGSFDFFRGNDNARDVLFVISKRFVVDALSHSLVIISIS